MVKVGVNGFGRIGRNVVRAALEHRNHDIEFVAVNDLTSPATLAYLLKYDSVHRTIPNDIRHSDTGITIDGKELRVYSNPDPADIPWDELGVEIVVESSGRFTSKDKASRHLKKSVSTVIISAPSKDADATFCMGVNEDQFDPAKHQIISNASCTTNCLAPVAKVLHQRFGITMGIMTTIHSYTNDQEILDLPHKDLRRGRAAALSMIPTSTGAAQAVGLVLPELKGKFDGISVRVPTPNVSLVDLTFETEKPTNVDEINQVLRDAADGELKGILAYSDEQLVSVDFNHNAHSSILDTTFTRSVNPRMHKILAWYDNEWGYSNRILDLIAHVAHVKKEALAMR
ncbi:MAG: type I glyceraldehyde-3-phosphate dehydrogenase [Acidobacteria bacterium]|nr:type I glyceraldehyde-3-phosphate dehydrogenase [Acidobacteriota bacterium]MBV9475725.1 type I glyceraldehyde-3-phosphate dehydrogenase [Acidobacteriota bacterium]